jgi:hypothetical protein
MKKIYFIQVLIFYTCVCYAQEFCISGGLKNLNVKNGTVLFRYIDESPAPDVIDSYIPLTGTKLAFNIAADWRSEQKSNTPFYIARANGYIGKVLGADIGFGIGKSFEMGSSKKIAIQPEITAIIGLNSKKLGDLEVVASGSIFIQVNSTIYDNYEPVAISLRNTYYGLRPAINFVVNADQSKKVVVQLGYSVVANSSTISFNGLKDGENVTELEKLRDDNLAFFVNNKLTQKSPISASGFDLKIGLIMPLHK